jgi:hypothetical protein
MVAWCSSYSQLRARCRRLQLRADYLSDGDVMAVYWNRREASGMEHNRYRCAS